MYILNFQNVHDPNRLVIWLTLLKKSRFSTVNIVFTYKFVIQQWKVGYGLA